MSRASFLCHLACDKRAYCRDAIWWVVLYMRAAPVYIKCDSVRLWILSLSSCRPLLVTHNESVVAYMIMCSEPTRETQKIAPLSVDAGFLITTIDFWRSFIAKFHARGKSPQNGIAEMVDLLCIAFCVLACRYIHFWMYTCCVFELHARFLQRC